MNKPQELAIVKKLTQIDDEHRIVLNEIGWTSRVYIVDNGKFVFKFPRGKKYKEECEHEFSILKLISEYEFNVNLPVIKWLGEDTSYAGFHGVQGKSITAKSVDKLSERQKRDVGTQIGLFLKKLHTIDYKGDSPTDESSEIESFQKSFFKKKRTLKKHFNESELDAIEELVTSLPLKSANLGTEYVFCHCDLGYNNILLTDDCKVGIIDFGDAGIFEKSYDFTGLEDDTMLDATIVAYGGDEVLREKVAIRRQLLPLMEMLFLIDRKDEEGIVQCAGRMRNNIAVLRTFAPCSKNTP
ncbi:MAG: aminoglycoside phosphotransferase family protein [Dysgonomonas sp.]|nr:aminoglycoside phosphotransferase family protein [Dysgonomonas sp.]